MKASTIFICLELVFLMFAVEDAENFVRRRRRRYCPPIACQVSEWSTWSNCSLPCGTNGQKTRTRTVTKPAACGGACPSVLSETQICNAEESHCHDQGTPRDDYCACKGGYTGNCCEMKCGGNFDGKEGTFHYEGFPGTKVGDCTWTAHTPQQSTVTAKIDSCSLLVSGETSGYIEIRYGDVTDFNEAHILRNVTQSDCEEGLVHVEYTTSNKMWIRLHAPEILQEKVYFQFKFKACGGKIELMQGSITSPFYPESYVKDGACNWTVQTPHATVISANFANFTLRSSDDFVLIGNTEGAGDIGRYGNNDTYRYIADTTKNRLWLSLQAFEFEERDLAERLGFRFEFQAKFVATAEIISGYNGSTFSPLYPLSYPTNVTFTTTISTPTRTGTIVRLEFTELNIRRGDNVSVYDDAGNLIAAYDHDNDVAVVLINSSMSSVILRSGFSDNPTIGTYRFTFQALTVCFRPTEMNGNVIPEQPFYEPGDVMVITCKEGHELSTNNAELTCQNDGNWNAEVPGCLDVINGDNIIVIVVTIVSILLITTGIVLFLMCSRLSKISCPRLWKSDQDQIHHEPSVPNRNADGLGNEKDLNGMDGRSVGYSNEGILQADEVDHRCKKTAKPKRANKSGMANVKAFNVNTKTLYTCESRDYMHLTFPLEKSETTGYSTLCLPQVKSGEMQVLQQQDGVFSDHDDIRHLEREYVDCYDFQLPEFEVPRSGFVYDGDVYEVTDDTTARPRVTSTA